jgi:hypothetical protein
MAVVNRMQPDVPAEPERDLVAERDDIVEKVFDLVQSLLPDDGSGMPAKVERQVASISRSISLALGIRPQDQDADLPRRNELQPQSEAELSNICSLGRPYCFEL